MLWVLVQLASQVLDMRVDRPLVAFVVVALHARDELVPREDPARTRSQREEQVELAPRQLDRFPFHQHLPSLAVDREPAVVERERAGALTRALPGPPQDRLHARHELPGAEGLHQVVVRSEAEALDAIVLGRLGRQHDDRRRGQLPHRTCDLLS